MSTVSITINDSDLRRGLRALESSAADMTPAMRKIAGTLHAETDSNFDESGWPEWIVSQAAEDRDGQTLCKTGRLQGSVSTEYDPRTAMIGTNTVYGAIHQFGGKTGRNESVELPARICRSMRMATCHPRRSTRYWTPSNAILHQRRSVDFRRNVPSILKNGLNSFIKALQPQSSRYTKPTLLPVFLNGG